MRTMTITVSPKGGNEDLQNQNLAQSVNFINILEGALSASSRPTAVAYPEINDAPVVALLNYIQQIPPAPETGILYPWEGVATIYTGESVRVSLYKQEMGWGGPLHDIPIALSPLQLVASNISAFRLKDFNVANDRWYRYVLYPARENSPLARVDAQVKTHWEGWSITELHPVDSTGKNFTASTSDVWVFNLNVSTGTQSQHLARNEQQTLGRYARYSQGLQNYISGQVSALLGSQVLPASWVQKTPTSKMEYTGGYTEALPYVKPISSNDRVAMLNAWRNLVYSHNPKLLKDRKGQVFLVTLTDASNQPQDNVRLQPDTISFSWHQIGTLDGVQILDTSLIDEVKYVK